MTELDNSLHYDAEEYFTFDPVAPLDPIKNAVKEAESVDKDLIPGKVLAAVKLMAASGLLDDEARVNVRAYLKKHRLVPAAEFDAIIESARRTRKRLLTTLPTPDPSADDAHLHTPPAWASEQDILTRVVRTLRVCMGLVGENRNAKLVYLALTSRLLDKQVSAVVKGLSSSGKSYTIQCVVVLFPPEAVYTMTAMSERALIYLDEPLSHRTIVLYEATALREGREKADDNQTAYIVRSLLSEGQIEYPVVVRQEDGTLKTEKLIVPGPTNLVTSTTSISLHPENETRMLSLASNDSKDQTRRVLISSSDDDEPGRAPDVDDWHAYQRWLRQRHPQGHHPLRQVRRSADPGRRRPAAPRLEHRPLAHPDPRADAPAQQGYRRPRPHHRHPGRLPGRPVAGGRHRRRGDRRHRAGIGPQDRRHRRAAGRHAQDRCARRRRRRRAQTGAPLPQPAGCTPPGTAATSSTSRTREASPPGTSSASRCRARPPCCLSAQPSAQVSASTSPT